MVHSIKANNTCLQFPGNDCQTCDGIFYLATLKPVEENLLLHCALLQCHLLHHISGRYCRHILVNLKYIFQCFLKGLARREFEMLLIIFSFRNLDIPTSKR